MSIPQNPANTRLATDVKIYRRTIQVTNPRNPNAAQEIRNHLNGKAPGRFTAAPGNADIVTPNAYRTFTSWQSGEPFTNQDWVEVPNRLGGGLDDTPNYDLPNHLDSTRPGGLPNPPAAGGFITWTPPGHPPITVEILPGGVIRHTDAAGVEIHDAHHYMHGIFNQILYTVRKMLEGINQALTAYADIVSITNSAATEAAAYSAAVTSYENYVANLQPGGTSPLAGSFNFVGVNPVLTNEGFIVSCRVKINWRNPYHSSSTIKIP